MQVFCDIPENPPRACVATIGFFDGVHLGHRCLIEQVCEAAAVRGLASGVVTFPVHPRKVVQPEYRPELLTTCEEKLSLLSDAALDCCLLLDFTPEIAGLSAREFMAFLRDHYNIRALVVGYDHRFGHNRSEGFDDYVRYGQALGMEVILAHAYMSKDVVPGFSAGAGREMAVSSSCIRRLLSQGNVSEAAAGLGYDYFLNGTVVGGHRVGRTIGYPTANLRVNEPDKLIPSDGVYAVRVTVAGQVYGGMLSIGCRPTVDNGTDRSIEVHIFGFHADIYGQPIRLSFVRYLRPELKFDSLDGLVAQLRKDAEDASRYL